MASMICSAGAELLGQSQFGRIALSDVDLDLRLHRPLMDFVKNIFVTLVGTRVFGISTLLTKSCFPRILTPTP